MLSDIRNCMIEPAAADEDGTIKAKFLFPESFTGFKGHFPGKPILPAVVQLQIAQVCIANHLGHAVGVSRVLNGKFMDMAEPEEVLVMTCVDKGEDRFGCSLASGETAKAISKFKIAIR